MPVANMAGNDVFVCSTETGGRVVEFSTAAQPGVLLAGTWTPSKMLHWVGTREEGARRLDSRQIRGIPFTNRWVHHCLQSASHTRIRLAPIHPSPRNPITCTCCGHMYVSPHTDPCSWMNHFGAHMQASRNERFVCFDCCVYIVSRRVSNVFR